MEQLPTRDVNICLEQFDKFYNLLMKKAPDGYIPWFFTCAKGGKNPATNGSWHDESARLTKEQAMDKIRQGFNIGISAREGDPLILIDIDEDKYLEQLPKDTLTATSRKRAGAHAFCWDKDGSAKINLPTDYGEVRSNNQYVLACGSFVQVDKKVFDTLPQYAKINKQLGYYTVRDYNSPTPIDFDGLPQLFKDKENENINIESGIKQREETKTYEDKEGKYSELFKLKVSDIVEGYSSNTRNGHPLHDSDTDANFSLSKDGSLGQCWRHLVSLNAVQFLCAKAGYMNCEDCGTPHKGRGLSKIKGDKKALKIAYDEAVKMKLISEWEETNDAYAIFGVQAQVEQFYKKQPFFYDKSMIFYFWNFEESKYEMVDKVGLLNQIRKNVPGVDTMSSKTKSEIINALEQVGREKIPKDLPKTCIQFKNKVIDVVSGEEMEATPEYFTTSPIPWAVGESEETPTIDKLIGEWVVNDGSQNHTYIKTMKQIIAYTISSDQFMQRIIALCGAGMNGKGTFINLVNKFVGEDNSCATNLKTLAQDNFETSALYKKLLCVMGEVDSKDMQSTNTIKELSGEDKMRYCFKNKTAFTAESPTTCLIATNSLPTTPDKSIGFYRRWLIIDFPHQFTVKRDLIGQIPDIEYENLARCCLNLLKEMYTSGVFENEGDILSRSDKYEERSNPVMKFVQDECEEDFDKKIEFKKFAKLVNEHLKSKKLRPITPIQIGKTMRTEGFDVSPRKIKDASGNEISARFLIGLDIKTTQTTQTTAFSTNGSYRESSSNSGSSGSSGSFLDKKLSNNDDVDDFFDKMRSGYQSEGLL